MIRFCLRKTFGSGVVIELERMKLDSRSEGYFVELCRRDYYYVIILSIQK